jgi:DNA invertase Pin-like site-specific DNA recombinase
MTSAGATKLFIAYHFLPMAERSKTDAELELQRAAVRNLVGANPDHEIIRIGSGHREQWPKLREAVRLAFQNGGQLVIGRLDRLTRNAAFLQIIAEAPIDVAIADMPHATREAIGGMAKSAQTFSEAKSRRTKAALAAARARGVKLGGDRRNLQLVGNLGRKRSIERRRAMAEEHIAKIMPYIDAASAAGRTSYRRIAEYLNLHGLRTIRGKRWTGQAVHKLIGTARSRQTDLEAAS